MNKRPAYIVGFLGAVVMTVMLRVLMEDDFGISPGSIAVDSLASAGILSLACAAGVLVKAKK
jgi:hypothetical protein